MTHVKEWVRPALKFLAVAAVFSVGSAAAQGTGKNGVFTVHNDTPGNTVVGFYTNDGAGWSTNWLSEKLEPGDTTKMEFTKGGGACKQTLRVGWLSKSGGEVKDKPIGIDICQTTNVYLHDNEITFD